jgi:vesicle transport through interaction with t-SNAREs protein 1
MALRLDVSDMFSAWEKDFQRLIGSVKQRAAALESAQTDDKEALVLLYKQDLAEAEKCLKQMEIEVSMLPPAAKGKLQVGLKRNKDLHEGFKRALRQEEANFAERRNRASLLKEKTGSDPRRSLLKAHEMAIDQGSRLERSRQTALESEGVAIATILTLQSQREQILRSTKSAGEVGDHLSKSNRLLTTMTRQTFTNKLIMLGVIGLLVLAIMIVAYYKVVSRVSSQQQA